MFDKVGEEKGAQECTCPHRRKTKRGVGPLRVICCSWGCEHTDAASNHCRRPSALSASVHIEPPRLLVQRPLCQRRVETVITTAVTVDVAMTRTCAAHLVENKLLLGVGRRLSGLRPQDLASARPWCRHERHLSQALARGRSREEESMPILGTDFSTHANPRQCRAK